MILAFVAAGIGNLIRTKLIKHHFTLFLNIAVSISASCFIYAAFLKIAEMAFNVPSIHEAGYICSMLFIIPGFPFITSGIDLAKLDLRSGLERLAYAIIIVMVATMFAWIMALLLRLQPMDFEDLNLTPVLHLILRLIMSFFGVFGFSIMFNSPAPMAATAALIGAIANSLRLELVDLTGMPAPAAAFAGALTAGLLASFIKENNGYPRISLTVPSIVIMVPGLYLYRAIYNFGIMALSDAVSWFASAIMIIIALPLGLIFARILTDKTLGIARNRIIHIISRLVLYHSKSGQYKLCTNIQILNSKTRGIHHAYSSYRNKLGRRRKGSCHRPSRRTCGYRSPLSGW